MHNRVMIFFCLQMPDVGSDKLFQVNVKHYFLSCLILQKPGTPMPPKKSYKFTKKPYLNYPLKQNENSYSACIN